MVIKRKKNCKIILENNYYYVEMLDYCFKFADIEDAKYFYQNCKKISLDLYRKYDVEGKVCLDLYPQDIELILKGIEQLKFFVDKSLYFYDDKEKLKQKSIDCFYLYQYIYTIYKHQVPKEKQNL